MHATTYRMAQCANCQSAPSSSKSKSAPSCIPVVLFATSVPSCFLSSNYLCLLFCYFFFPFTKTGSSHTTLKSRCAHCYKNLFFCRVFFHSHRPCNLIYKTFKLLKEECKEKDDKDFLFLCNYLQAASSTFP